MGGRPPKVRSRTQAHAGRVRVLRQDRPRPSGPVDGLSLNGRRLDMQLGDRLLDAQLTRTIEGPNEIVLTLYDHDRAVLGSGIFGSEAMANDVRVELDGLGFIAEGLSKTGDNLDVTLHDEVVVVLKRHGKGHPLRTSRKKVTRAHFCATMIRQAGVPVIVLDEDIVQPIAGRKKLREQLRKAQRSGDSNRASGRGGFAGAGLTIKGVRATSEQLRSVSAALDEAEKIHAGKKARQALLVAGIAEGQFVPNRPNGAGSGAIGPWQIMPATAANLGIKANDVRAGARHFLRGGFTGHQGGGAVDMERLFPHYTPGDIANAVEGGGAGGHFYQQWIDEANAFLDAAKGSAEIGSGSTTHAWLKTYAFERRRSESTWACASRLLVDEVGWRLFVREGVVIIASDPALMRAQPALTISERSEQIETLDFDWARALKIGEMNGQAYLGRWEADPGEVIAVHELPVGDKHWLLAAVRESLYARKPLADITLRQPQAPKPEPAPQVATESVPTVTAGSASGKAKDFYAACKEIDGQDLPYVWGGGHAKAGTPDRGTGRDPGIGYDCSGSVAAALAAAGMGLELGQSVPGSGWFATNWGAAGRGKDFTVWANDVHIFVELHFPGKAASFDTRRIGDNRRGPHLRTQVGPTAGFTPRHWGETAAPPAIRNAGQPGMQHGPVT